MFLHLSQAFEPLLGALLGQCPKHCETVVKTGSLCLISGSSYSVVGTRQDRSE